MFLEKKKPEGEKTAFSRFRIKLFSGFCFQIANPFYSTEFSDEISVVAVRNNVPQRYLVKDLAGLYFSAMQYMELEKKDVYHFLKAYYKLPLREIFLRYGNFLEKVRDAASAVYRKDMKKEMKKLF